MTLVHQPQLALSSAQTSSLQISIHCVLCLHQRTPSQPTFACCTLLITEYPRNTKLYRPRPLQVPENPAPTNILVRLRSDTPCTLPSCSRLFFDDTCVPDVNSFAVSLFSTHLQLPSGAPHTPHSDVHSVSLLNENTLVHRSLLALLHPSRLI